MNIGFKKSAWLLLAGAAVSDCACANLADVAEQYSPDLKLERAVALATLQTYSDLLDSGCSYYDQSALSKLSAVSLAAAPAAPCTGATRRLFENMRQLADTANEISNDESSTQYSLGYTARQLGTALRATAAEEYSAQGSLSSDFVKGQFSALSARLTSLRLGANGFSLNNSGTVNSYAAYASSGMSGGGAGADTSEGYSRLGGFINIGYGDGKKTATNLENAFSVDGIRINAGLDYRLDPYWVVGAVVGASNQSLDFTRTGNVSAGKIESEGYNIMPFVLFQGDQFYASVSLGRQFVDFDSLRIVSYPGSPNPATPDTKTESSTNALVTSLSAEFGYNFTRRQFAFEPFVRVNSSSTSIHKFVERDLNDAAFDLAVAGQDFKSRLYTFGANLRYTFTPSFAVITPFISAEQVKEANTKQHLIAARYVNAASQTNVFQFVGDTPDDAYRVFTLGLSSVLLGGHQVAADGVVAGGLQGFINYKVVEGLRDYTLETIELGLRYEF